MELGADRQPVLPLTLDGFDDPSGQRAVTAKPGATSSTAMWCRLLTRISPSPYTRSISEPGTTSRLWRCAKSCRSLWGIAAGTSSGCAGTGCPPARRSAAACPLRCEYGQLPLGDQPHQHPVEHFAPRFQNADRRMKHESVAPGVEIGAANQHKSLELVENPPHVGIALQRWHNHGHTARARDAVIVPGTDVGETPARPFSRSGNLRSVRLVDGAASETPFPTRCVSEFPDTSAEAVLARVAGGVARVQRLDTHVTALGGAPAWGARPEDPWTSPSPLLVAPDTA